MKKSEQTKINNECLNAYKVFNDTHENVINIKRLRTCSAKVLETPSYYILVSYSTPIAFIDKATDTLYDVLRHVYGYTSTSAQHIAKFSKDYGRGKWGCLRELRYYSI